MTSATQPQRLALDPALLDHLAEIVCGDDRAYHRRGWEIARLFDRAGWKWVGDEIEPSRMAWTREVLQDQRATPEALADLVSRLASPVEYVDEPAAYEEALSDLRTLLGYEGLTLDLMGPAPRICPIGEVPARSPERGIGGSDLLELDVSLSQIVGDEEFGAQLERRLGEARVCWEQGAYLSATVMLGSVVEGVLYDRAVTTGAGNTDNLNRLIELAVAEKWINPDTAQYAHVLRDHRNLVHPKKQHVDGHLPDVNSVRIAWNVTIAVARSLVD